MLLRNIRESDHAPVISVVDAWWGGRHMADMLPRLFFKHFQDTSFVIEEEGQLVAFLIGFVSQTYPDEAYIHFVGVHPQNRQQGLGERLYEHFFDVVRSRGCQRVSCVTSPINKGSIAFHTRMGFVAQPSDTIIDGVPAQPNYDGQGGDRVLFSRAL